MFGFGKTKSVEVMISEATTVGLALRPGVSLDQLFAEWPREKIEADGFELLMCAMGGEPFDPATFKPLEPFCDDVWHFDTEAIEDQGAYKRIIDNCCRLTGGDLNFERVVDFVDVTENTAWAEITNAGETQRIEFKVDNDWVDEKVFDEIDRRLELSGSARRLASHGLGQDVLLICKTPAQTKAINNVLGLKFRKLKM